MLDSHAAFAPLRSNAPDIWVEGIFDRSPNPVPASYSFTNSWQGTVGNARVQVYVGSAKYERTRGVLFVLSQDESLSGFYEWPFPRGPVSIQEAAGDRLTVSAENDPVHLTFDVSSGSLTP